jgi:hypothetical protein
MDKSTRLLASLALFKSLYVSQSQDVYKVLSQFIQAAIHLDHLNSFTSTEMLSSLRKNFDFDLLDAVVKKCLMQLVKQDELTYSTGYFQIKQTSNYSPVNLQPLIEEKQKYYKNIINDIISSYEEKRLKRLSENETKELENSFNSFLLGEHKDSEYLKYISQYIIEREKKGEDKNELNSIKEGLVIYNGMKYTDAYSTDIWKNDTIFFLDTEYLFSAVGYNGELYQKLFYDFYNLVKEVNERCVSKGGQTKIKIRYFQDIKEEIEKYFDAAKKIKQGKETLDPSKEAMRIIINSCNDVNDIYRKKADFFAYLKRLDIEEYPEIEITDPNNIKYLLETEERIKTLLSSKKYNKEEDDKILYLKLCDFINILRRGQNTGKAENIKYVLLSANGFAIKFSIELSKTISQKYVPFISLMDFYTDKLWFNLRKGFNPKETATSFDVIARAQIVLSSLVQKDVSYEYEKLKEEMLRGEMDMTTANSYYFYLRNQNITPDLIDTETASSAISFLEEENKYAIFIKKQIYLEQESKKVPELNKQIDSIAEEKEEMAKKLKDMQIQIQNKNKIINEERNKKIKKSCILLYMAYKSTKIIPILLFLAFSIYGTYRYLYSNNNESELTYWSFILAIIALLIYIPIIQKKLQRIVSKKILIKYRKKLRYYSAN